MSTVFPPQARHAAPGAANLTWHASTVTRQARARRNGHRAVAVWLTGLSGAGKSTLAHAIEARLHGQGRQVFVLDGDNVRHGLCADLGFSETDRAENIRRVGEVARLFVESGTIVLAAFISPLRADRDRARALFAPGDFVEVHCDASLSVCEERDVKGLYRRARAGQIPQFTGVSAPYEAPAAPDLQVRTGELPLEACVDQVLAHLMARGVLGTPPASRNL